MKVEMLIADIRMNGNHGKFADGVVWCGLRSYLWLFGHGTHSVLFKTYVQWLHTPPQPEAQKSKLQALSPQS